MKEKRFPPAARIADDDRILLVETEVYSREGRDAPREGESKVNPALGVTPEEINVTLFIVNFKCIRAR